MRLFEVHEITNNAMVLQFQTLLKQFFVKDEGNNFGSMITKL
jgi:hypothetical protein